MTIASLIKDYDRLHALRDGLAAELELDVSGEGQRARIEAIAAAVRAGKPAPAIWPNRAAKELEIKGVNSALDGVAIDIAEELAKGRKRPPKSVALPDLTPTGEELVVVIEANYEASERGRIATEAALDERRRYEVALNAFNVARAGYIGEGEAPAAASDKAKTDLGAQADDLFPKGSPGDLNFRGRVRGETLTSTATTQVPA
jgi:hypothetical protein